MLPFLYHSLIGRLILKPITAPCVSQLAGRFLDTRKSTLLIPLFIKKFGIQLDEVKPAEWQSFNEFFARRLMDGARPVDMDADALISPCDGYLTAYEIHEDTVMTVKDVRYTVTDLLGDARAAAEYRGGTCLVFRLTPSDYHRYCYPDSGSQGPVRRIEGVLHTVQPIATQARQVYVQNSREYTVLDTDHFGRMVFWSVGYPICTGADISLRRAKRRADSSTEARRSFCCCAAEPRTCGKILKMPHRRYR